MEAGEPRAPGGVSQRKKKELELIVKMCIENHFTGLLQDVRSFNYGSKKK